MKHHSDTPENHPQRHAEGQTPPTPTRHIHPPEQTLTDYEDAELFKLYLNGRDSAYARVLDDIEKALTEAQKSQETYTGNHLIWTLAEGQIEGLKEIRNLLQRVMAEEPKG